MSAASTPSFRGRPVKALSFGTSGLRGLVEDLTDLEAWVTVTGFLRFLERSGLSAPGPVHVAGDLRPSTGRILSAVARAIEDAGYSVVDEGRVPSPTLAFAAFGAKRPSVMVTGSHIPFDRNGIKLCLPEGEAMKADEAPILEGIAEARRAADALAPEDSPFDDDGMLLPSAVPAPGASGTAHADFVARYVGFFGADALEGLRLAIYQHSAVGRDLLVELLSALGARVEPVGRSETFVAVDTEAVSAPMLAEIVAAAAPAKEKLGGLDAILSTDGDSDRPLLVAVNAAGEASFVRGDTLGALVAEDLDADAVAVPVSVSDLIDLHLGGKGTHIERTRIGSPYVIEAMAAMDGVCKVGFEANGGFLLETRVERKEVLGPLPTRDAFLPMISVLATQKHTGVGITERVAALPARFAAAGLVDAVPREVAQRAISVFAPAEPILELWLDGIRSRAREAGEHPRSLAPSREEALQPVLTTISDRFGELGALRHASWVDGVRLAFEGGDVIHLRPSGNAPQFRLYTLANTAERAQELVELGLGPDGAVTKLLAESGSAGTRLM